jgi:hypothetical protein
MRIKLTKKVVESLAAGVATVDTNDMVKAARDVVVWDSEVPGFGVKVTPTGRRAYFVYYRTAAVNSDDPRLANMGL